MFEKLNKLLNSSQAKYSDFFVASIILDKNNNEYKGVNIEYDVPTNSICAERNAIANAFTNGMKFGELKEVHILGKKTKKPNKDLFVFPCGVCRQAIIEASASNAMVFIYDLNGNVKSYKINDLVPHAFTGKEIK